MIRSATMSRPPQRPIKNILIANRGEIAIRILQAIRELPPHSSNDSKPITTFAIYTPQDSTHVSLGRPDHAIQIPSPASYMDVSYLIKIVQDHQIDAVHPGYGFLSESAEFSRRMWEEAKCMVIGPGWDVLERTGDKLQAKALAAECQVPVLKAMSSSTGDVGDVKAFVWKVGLPVMIKAVDGGGGRGIRLVEDEKSLENAVQRCISESASGKVFAEQAATDGFKHIEIQIVGDGRGGVKHLWERDCSVQRRFQKIVEVAPTPVSNRKIVAKVIESAIRMARVIKYLGLGTFEFLVNVQKRQFFFLEINPRLQVEHTITESICGMDLVQEQLLIAQGLHDRDDTRFGEWWEAEQAPKAFSIQLRLCAEDPLSNFSLSIGKVTDIKFPHGNGIRVDSHLHKGGVVGSDFDNLMAKILVTASSWQETVAKAQRALADTKIEGVKTNLNLLQAVVADRAFQVGRADTKWLEANIDRLVERGQQIGRAMYSATGKLPEFPSTGGSSAAATGSSSSLQLRKGDAWSLVLEDPDSKSKDQPPAHHLRINKIGRNEFPEALVADLSYTLPGAQPRVYKVTVNTTSSSSDATSSSHRRGDVNNKSHIVLPMSGKLVEVLVEEGDVVEENQVIAFVKQMKMELEIRSPRPGTIGWVIDLENEEEGDDVAEGVLLAELETESLQKPVIKSKL